MVLHSTTGAGQMANYSMAIKGFEYLKNKYFFSIFTAKIISFLYFIYATSNIIASGTMKEI